MNKENNRTYVLIRNGENIYRIWGDIEIGEKLFPDQDELTHLVDQLNGVAEIDPNNWRERTKQEAAEKADNVLERYKLNMILLQGIIERTPCFPDNAETTSIFAPGGYDGKIRFVYDDTLKYQLPHNIQPFWSWMRELSAQITEGSRIYWSSAMNTPQLAERDDWYRGDDQTRRWFRMDYNKYNTPHWPNTGIYTLFVEKGGRTLYDGSKKDIPFIKYKPEGERVWSWSDDWETDRTRKNKLAFSVEYSECINWDALDRYQLPKLEYYLHTRIGRDQYLRYMKLLHDIMLEKRKEMATEDDFIKLALTQAGFDPEKFFDTGVRAMEWWKLKNKWKRALSADDSKALRMVVGRLVTIKKDMSKLYKTLDQI